MKLMQTNLTLPPPARRGLSSDAAESSSPRSGVRWAFGFRVSNFFWLSGVGFWASLTCAFVLTHAAFAQTWRTVDDLQYVAGQPAQNFGLTVAPSGTVLAAGFGFDASGTSHGLVVSSAGGDSTWSGALDDFVYPGWQPLASAKDVAPTPGAERRTHHS